MAELQRKEGEDGQLLMREGIHELSESQEKQQWAPPEQNINNMIMLIMMEI